MKLMQRWMWEHAHPGEYISVLVNNAGIRR